MGWKCFKFWFAVRLLLALLAHFNWFTAIYVKCMYFTFWKSYDLLWFWMHLVLCICFKPLRPENFLLVWINIIRHKCKSPEKSYRQIYNMLYNSKFTKSERKLREIENEEKNEQDSDSDLGNEAASVLYPQLENKSPPKVQIKLQKDSNEDDALIEISKNPGSSTGRGTNEDDKKSTASKSKVLDRALPGILKKKLHLGDKDPEANEDEKSGNWKDKIGLQKLIPGKFQRSVSNDGTVDEEKERQKDAKKAEKTKLKEARRQRKIELRKQAQIERQRKTIADSIELLLQCLRSCCALAILTGNIRRHFAPVTGFESSYNTAYNNPELLMLFTVTTSIDVFLFSLMMFLTYFKQCRLCCRLGICKFWIWAVVLVSLMFGTMLKPMHYIHQQLDPTWCSFMPGSDLGDYLG